MFYRILDSRLPRCFLDNSSTLSTPTRVVSPLEQSPRETQSHAWRLSLQPVVKEGFVTDQLTCLTHKTADRAGLSNSWCVPEFLSPTTFNHSLFQMASSNSLPFNLEISSLTYPSRSSSLTRLLVPSFLPLLPFPNSSFILSCKFLFLELS